MSAILKHLLTAQEFAALPHEGLRLDLVRGEIVAMALAFDDHGAVAAAVSLRNERGIYPFSLPELDIYRRGDAGHAGPCSKPA